MSLQRCGAELPGGRRCRNRRAAFAPHCAQHLTDNEARVRYLRLGSAALQRGAYFLAEAGAMDLAERAKDLTRDAERAQ